MVARWSFSDSFYFKKSPMPGGWGCFGKEQRLTHLKKNLGGSVGVVPSEVGPGRGQKIPDRAGISMSETLNNGRVSCLSFLLLVWCRKRRRKIRRILFEEAQAKKLFDHSYHKCEDHHYFCEMR